MEYILGVDPIIQKFRAHKFFIFYLFFIFLTSLSLLTNSLFASNKLVITYRDRLYAAGEEIELSLSQPACLKGDKLSVASESNLPIFVKNQTTSEWVPGAVPLNITEKIFLKSDLADNKLHNLTIILHNMSTGELVTLGNLNLRLGDVYRHKSGLSESSLISLSDSRESTSADFGVSNFYEPTKFSPAAYLYLLSGSIFAMVGISGFIFLVMVKYYSYDS